MQSKLSAEEKQRADKFRSSEDRTRYIASHYYTREILGKYLNLPSEQIGFAYNQYGKPELEGYEDAPILRFNPSHSDDIAVLTVTNRFKVVVDVERIRQNASTEDIARRFLSSREVDFFLNQPENIRDEAFFRCWTLKEVHQSPGRGYVYPLRPV
jgi:4'-phosphopantetheinyl transferase